MHKERYLVNRTGETGNEGHEIAQTKMEFYKLILVQKSQACLHWLTWAIGYAYIYKPDMPHLVKIELKGWIVVCLACG